MAKATSKTSAKGTAATSELAAASNATITVQSTSPLPIIADASNAWNSFSDLPSVAASLSALKSTREGFMYIWEAEQEERFGQRVFTFLWQIFKAVALPLLSLVWLALNKGYVWILQPETRATAFTKWQELKGWAAPKFGYETTAVEVAETE